MKVKLIKFCQHTFKKDEWVEDKFIPNKDDFFILKNSDVIYKCVGRVLYEGAGITLYVEKIVEI